MFSTQCTPYSPHSCTAEATRTNVEQWLIRSHRCYCSYYYRHHPQHRFYSYDLQSDFSWSTAILLFSFWGSVSWVGKPADTHTQEKKQNPAKQFKCTHRCQLKNTYSLKWQASRTLFASPPSLTAKLYCQFTLPQDIHGTAYQASPYCQRHAALFIS